MTDADLRSLLAAGGVTHLPGIYDPASAALAVRAGNRAVYLSGAAIAATMLGRPDVAFAAATQIADRASVLAGSLDGVPMLADATLGFDSADDAVWTALSYQRSGIGGLLLGDGEEVRPSAGRLIALADQAPALTVIAEAAGQGLAETIERARAYAAAGADAILPADVHRPADLDRIRHAIPGIPLVLTRSETSPGSLRLTDSELTALGVRMVLHPLAAVLAALRAESLAYRAIADEGTAERVDRMPAAVLATMTTPASLPPPAALVPRPVVTAARALQPTPTASATDHQMAKIDT